MRNLTAEDLAEKEQRAHEEREAARDSNPAATKRAKVARAKPTGHENTTTISGASESEYASDSSCSESESDGSMLADFSDGLDLSDSDWRGGS